jgi:rhamnose utilization protein RhaD (predicted bifunctional aldolase and dehydrogenase)/NAD(P)-dependent dehydrogenase (short-subunit alcohol dehydrogenase family)
MQNLWDAKKTKHFRKDPLQMRLYTARLLGHETDLVLHGGGNCSVKITAPDAFGDTKKMLYVKGSGCDLKTLAQKDLSLLVLETLHRIAAIPNLTDAELVRLQLGAMVDPTAPSPSIETVLHALIPFNFVDHTHADAVLALTNTPSGIDLIKKVYGKQVLVVPYVHPGFALAKKVAALTADIEWSAIAGIILMKHGIFTFGDDARQSYERMIELVSMAEDHLSAQGAFSYKTQNRSQEDLKTLSLIRGQVSRLIKRPMLAKCDYSENACGFANFENVAEIATRGPLTADHLIRTKPFPAILNDDLAQAVNDFGARYEAYFKRHATDGQPMLDTAPCWAVWPDHGLISFGQTPNEVTIVSDIVRHTAKTIQASEAFGGWSPLDEGALFDMEYWSLQQAKLNPVEPASDFKGQIALVTGAASGIGQACAKMLYAKGAAVVGIDINPDVKKLLGRPGLKGICCDLTDTEAVQEAVAETVRLFGGLDILVSNAGLFPDSCRIEDLDGAAWDRSMEINLTSHQHLLKSCIPYMKNGWEASVVFVASKNVPAPGPGAAAYSVAKAGLTQLARVAALELGCDGIRVNVIHPNAVYDTALWTPEVLASRACQYECTIDEYKTNNCLKTEVTSADVAELVCALAGPGFAKTTGAQIPIDGGNDRVI